MKRLLGGAAVVAVLTAAFFGAVPLAVRSYCGRARQLLNRREDQEALDRLRAALRLAPDQAEVHLLLARTHRRLGNLDRVEPLLRRARQLGADPERVDRERWLVLAQSGRLREAEPHLPALLEDPRDDGADICEAYVHGYFSNLRTQEARRLLEAWQRDYPDDARAFFMQGYLMQALGLLPEAIAAYRRGLELRPDETIMRCRLAELLAEEHDVDEAGMLFRRCAEESPEDVEILTAWATCLTAQGDLLQARGKLENVLEKAPDHFEALRQLGEIEVGAGNFERAVEYLERALDQRPYDTTTHNALGKSLRALGRTQESKVHFDYVTEAEQSLARMDRQLREVVTRPDDAQLRFEIGATLLKYGAAEDGARWLRTVLEVQPDHEAARQTLAAYYESRGDWQQAAPLRRQGAKQ